MAQIIRILFLICAIMLSLVYSQQTDISLSLETPLPLNLTKLQTQNIIVSLSNIQLKNQQSMFIHAASIINDPQQRPTLALVGKKQDGSQVKFKQTICENDKQDSSSTCRIKQSDLAGLSKLQIGVRCEQNSCWIQVQSYLSSVEKLKVSDRISIETKEEGRFFFFMFEIKELQEKFQIVADIRDISPTSQPVNMYVTYGDDPNLHLPSKTKSMPAAVASTGSKKIAVIDSAYLLSMRIGFPDSRYRVIVMVNMGKQTKVVLSTRQTIGNVARMQLNNEYEDYIYSEYRNYALDLQQILLSDEQFSLQIDIYSGNPQLEIKLFKKTNKTSQQSKTVLQNNYFVVPHSKIQFTKPQLQGYDKLNIRIHSVAQSSFGFKPILTRSSPLYQKISHNTAQYLYMSTKLTHLFKFSDSMENTEQEEIDFTINIQPYQTNGGSITVYQCVNAQGNFAAYESEEESCIQNKSEEYTQNVIPFVQHNRLITFSLKSSDSCINQYGHKISCPLYISYTEEQNSDSRVVITLKRENQNQIMKPGSYYLSYLSQNQSITYTFNYLNQTNKLALTQIHSVSFYLNCIMGSAQIIVSDQLSNSSSKATTNKFHENVVRLVYPLIYQKVYYVKVIASQQSECTVLSLVRFQGKEDNTARSMIPLEEGVTILHKLQRKIEHTQTHNTNMFTFTANRAANYNFVVMELEGIVNYRIKETSGKTVCEREEIGAGECQVPVQAPGTHYLMEVQEYEDRGYQQSVAIVVMQENSCFTYPFSIPIYQHLSPNQKSCIQFTTSIPKDDFSGIKFTTSMSTIQQMIEELTFELTLSSSFKNSKTIERQFAQNTYFIGQEDISEVCGYDEADCELHIRAVINSGSKEENLIVRVYKEKLPLQLYDGISHQKSNLPTLTHYFYNLKDYSKSVQIQLSSQQNVKFTVLTQLIDRTIYVPATSQLQLYPQNEERSIWSLTTDSNNPSMGTLLISDEELSKKMRERKIIEGRLLITVIAQNQFGLEYSIEVSQHERMLFEGETHIGYLLEGQKVNYELYIDGDAYLQIRPLSIMCFKAILQQQYHSSPIQINEQANLPLRGFNKISSPALLTISQSVSTKYCPYRITLQNIPTPESAIPAILEISQQFPHLVDLVSNEQTYLFFYHNRNSPLKIFEIVQSGDSEMEIFTFNKKQFNEWLDAGVWSSRKSAQFTMNEEQLFLEISNSDADFCYECYYVIKIKGSPSVKEEIIVNVKDSAVVLREKLVFEDIVKPEEQTELVYYLGQGQPFFLDVNVRYGQITLEVVDRLNNYSIKMEKISKSAYLPINYKSIQDKKAANPIFAYTIKISSSGSKTQYKIQANSYLNEIFVPEGATYTFMLGSQPKNIEIPYINAGQKITIIAMLKGTQPFLNKLQYTVALKRNPPHQNQPLKPRIINSIDGSYTVIEVTCNVAGTLVITATNHHFSVMAISITVPRHDLTEIFPQNRHFFKHQTIFELYIPADHQAVIELFMCEGSGVVRGSKQYSDLTGKWLNSNLQSQNNTDSSQQELVHENVGGHYVIRVKEGGESGEYFIRVQSKYFNGQIKDKISDLEYVIRYYLLSNNAPSPYQLVDLEDREVTITPKSNDIIIKHQNFQVIEGSKAKIQNIKYFYTLTHSRQGAERGGICVPKGKSYIEETRVNFQNQSQVTAGVQHSQKKSDIVRVIGKSEGYLGVTAQGTVSVAQRNLTYNFVVMSYEPVAMNRIVMNRQAEPAQSIMGWVLIICLVVGGLIVAYTLFVKALRYFRGYDNKDLTEETTVNELDNQKKEEKPELPHAIQ